jgi:dephospho-CoA kinase
MYTAPSSEVLREALRINSLREPSIQQLIERGQQYKAEFGPEVLIRWTLQKAFQRPEREWSRIAIDGLRTDEELRTFREMFGERARVIAITASIDALWERVLRRQEETGRIDYHSEEEFKATQAIEQARVQALIPLADVVIDNSGSDDQSRVEFEQQVIDITLSTPDTDR